MLAAALAVAVPDRFTTAGFTDPGSQSAVALDRLHAALGHDPEPGFVVLARPARGRLRAGPILRLQRRLARDPAVGRVRSAFGSGALPILLSPDRQAALVLVSFVEPGEQAAAEPVARLREIRQADLDLRFGGFHVGFADDNRIAREDLLRAELITVPILALLLVAAFRGVLAAALPLLVGGLAVLLCFATLRLLSLAFEVSIFALNLGLLLGLGLAVDYALFVVSRYREEVRERGLGPEAVRATMASAGRTVLFSSATVGAACAALLLFPQSFIRSMGVSGILVALFAAAAALLALPAALLLADRRIGAAEPGRHGAGARRWARLGGRVMRRPVVTALASGALLLALALPALDARLTFLDADALPPGLESRQVADEIERTFTPFLEFPVNVAVPVAPGRPEVAQSVRDGAARLPGVNLVGPVERPARDTAFFQLLLRGPPLSERSREVIEQLRASPGAPLVGGRTAQFVDLRDNVFALAPWALALAALATMLVLAAMTRSVVLPVKAVLMNALTLAAVLGLLVLVFQRDALGLAGLLGYTGPPAVETSTLVVIVAVTFGLATDYSILLLSRIKEEHARGAGTAEAVTVGLARSGWVITCAAAILAVAVLALATSEVFLVKQLAVGIALGVLLDATVVRGLLVPSLMRILDRANWWAPRWLRGRSAGAGSALRRG